jgi:hypothetical protein
MGLGEALVSRPFVALLRFLLPLLLSSPLLTSTPPLAPHLSSFSCYSPTPSLVAPCGVTSSPLLLPLLLLLLLTSPPSLAPHLLLLLLLTSTPSLVTPCGVTSLLLTYPHRPLVVCVLSHAFR